MKSDLRLKLTVVVAGAALAVAAVPVVRAYSGGSPEPTTPAVAANSATTTPAAAPSSTTSVAQGTTQSKQSAAASTGSKKRAPLPTKTKKAPKPKKNDPAAARAKQDAALISSAKFRNAAKSAGTGNLYIADDGQLHAVVVKPTADDVAALRADGVVVETRSVNHEDLIQLRDKAVALAGENPDFVSAAASIITGSVTVTLKASGADSDLEAKLRDIGVTVAVLPPGQEPVQFGIGPWDWTIRYRHRVQSTNPTPTPTSSTTSPTPTSSTTSSSSTSSTSTTPSTVSRGGMSNIYTNDFQTGWVCTSGFNVTIDGVPHMLTAGHCTDELNMNVWINNAADFIGKTISTRYADNGADYGLVKYTSGISAPGTVDNRSGGTIAVKGLAQDAVAGMAVCKYGQTTGRSCGTVTYPDVVVSYYQGASNLHLTQTSLCSDHGDSGSSVLSGQYALAVLSGGVTGECITFVQPIKPALTYYNATLTTS